MKILLASDHYPPFIGGAQRQTWLLARELRRRGHEVAVATVWQDTLPAAEDDDGVRVRRLRQLRTVAPAIRGRPRRRHQPPFPDPVTVIELRRLIGAFRPDVIHAAGWFAYSCAQAVARIDVPLVVSARDFGFSCPNTTLMRHLRRLCSGPGLAKCTFCAADYYGVPRGWVAAWCVLAFRPLIRRRATTIHSVSRYVDAMMKRDLMDADALRATHMEVIPSFRYEDAAPDGSGDVLASLPGDPFIMFVGALRRVKGIETLLAAYGRLPRAPPLVLVGTPEPDTPAVMPEGVVVIEGIPNWAVLRAWERSLFGVLPSLWPEPFGSVVHEAMSRGTAVIGTTPGGHADMIEDGVTGILTPAGDVDALYAAMERLIADAALRRRLGENARERARAFAADAVVPRYVRMYAGARHAYDAALPAAATTSPRGAP